MPVRKTMQWDTMKMEVILRCREGNSYRIRILDLFSNAQFVLPNGGDDGLSFDHAVAFHLAQVFVIALHNTLEACT